LIQIGLEPIGTDAKVGVQGMGGGHGVDMRDVSNFLKYEKE
jgi:hypothetical protein